MSAFEPGVYREIFRVRMAYRFDAACLLMRFYGYMMNIGTVSMLTLAGYSFLIAGAVSSVIAICIFLISPRVSKLIDEQGQSKVLPFACGITLFGLSIVLLDVHLQGPTWLLFVGAVPMGFIPSAQALARTRWTYLLRMGKVGDGAPSLRTVFSYEGVLDDIAFMFGPPFAIAAATALVPIAGLLIGGVAFAIGVALLVTARSTEPVVGWSESKKDALERSGQPVRQKSVFRTSSVVRILFLLLLLTGGFYGIFDTTSIALAEELGNPNIASIALMASALVSMFVGFAFGMIHIRLRMYQQLIVCAILIGCAYGSMMFINSEISFYVVSCSAALFYAPFLIVANSVCERAVAGAQLTEAIAWMNAGMTCGVALGPTFAGVIVDMLGVGVSFDMGAGVALAIPVVAILCLRILRRDVKDETYEIVEMR